MDDMRSLWIFFLFVSYLEAQNCTVGYTTLNSLNPCGYALKKRSTAILLQVPPTGFTGAAYFYLGDHLRAGVQLGLTLLVPLLGVLTYYYAPYRCLIPGTSSRNMVFLTLGFGGVVDLIYSLVGVVQIANGQIKDGNGQPLN